MTVYVCSEPLTRKTIHGGYECAMWVEQSTSFVDEFAITKQQAGEVSLSICALLVLAYVGGLIGRAMLQV